jgi:hypothetical protein
MGMMNMMMAPSGGRLVVPLPGGSFSYQSGSSITVTLQFASDGTANTVVTGQGTIFQHRWWTKGSNPNAYVRATLQSGDTPSGTLNTWLQLNTTRQWSVTASAQGQVRFSSLLIQISLDGGNTVASSGTYQIEAEYLI